jgi:hypothetical protein
VKHARLSLFITVVLAVVAWGCGGGGGGVSSRAALTISPTFAMIGAGESVNLTAQPSGLSDPTVVWSVSGGSVVATGPTTATYTAPSQTGSYQVTATSQQNGALIATAIIEVIGPGVTVRANSIELVTGASTDITAAVIGMQDRRVTWTVSGGTFEETSEGAIRYTAPEQTGTYTVTATSVADPTKSDSVTITVVERKAIVRGRVRARANARTGIYNVVVIFFDANGAEVGRTATLGDGTFGAELPMTARRFHLDPASINSSRYHSEYTYGSLVYDADVATCTAPLPAFEGRLELSLPSEIVLTETGIRPPIPTGCV